MRIELCGLAFYAYHGYHAEEQKLGAHYLVDVTLLLDAPLAAEADELTGTVDYTTVYNLVAARMATPAKLLEHLAYTIGQAIAAMHPGLHGGTVRIAKLHPPFGGLAAQVAVAYGWGTLA